MSMSGVSRLTDAGIAAHRVFADGSSATSPDVCCALVDVYVKTPQNHDLGILNRCRVAQSLSINFR